MDEVVHSFKGFNKDLKCRGEQFVIGEQKSVVGGIVSCENGYHACEEPLRVFQYYPPAASRYCRVEQSGDMKKKDDKIASRTIKVGAEIGIPGLVKAQIEYVKAHTTYENTDPEKATAGEYGAATAGNCGAATAGEYGAATAGYRGAATAGNCGAATAGYRGAATAGYRGAATSRGSSAVGKNGIACARGNECKVKGGIGALLIIAEESGSDYGIKDWKAVVVDGKTVKADTWYKLVDGELEEVTE